MPVSRSPPYTRSRSRRSQSEEPLPGVTKHPVAPIPISPSSFSNIPISPSPFANVTISPSILDPALNQYIRERKISGEAVASTSAKKLHPPQRDTAATALRVFDQGRVSTTHASAQETAAATALLDIDQERVSTTHDSAQEAAAATALQVAGNQAPNQGVATNNAEQVTNRQATATTDRVNAREEQPLQAYNMAQVAPAVQDWETFARALLANRPSLPEFHGRDHEDPETFLTRCTEYFTASQTPETQRTQTAEAGLKGVANQWWDAYRLIGVGWTRFQELLRHRFDSIQVKNSLLAQLYTKKQGDKEAVGTFLQQKYLMYQRLRPEEPEATKLATLVGLLRSSLKKTLRLNDPTDFADLLTKALEAEKEEAEDAADQKSSRPKKEPLSEDKKPAQKSLPQCWYCPGQHYNRDCEVRKAQLEASRPTPENWRAAAEAPAPPAKPAPPRQ